MAFFLQYKAIRRHAEEQIQHISVSDEEHPATSTPSILCTAELGGVMEGGLLPGKSSNDDPFLRIPGIKSRKDHNGEQYYEVGWTTPDDPFNPKTWSSIRRILSTVLVCVIALIATLVSSIDSAVLTRAAQDFGVSEVVESLATGIFLIGLGLGALLLSPLSELVGRFPVYLGSLIIYGAWILGTALAPNIGAQLAFRFLAGISASAPLTVAGGTVGDLFSPLEKTFAFPLFAVPAFGGPVFGPVISGYIGYERRINWHWADWIALLLVGATFLLIVTCKRETFGPRILYYRAKHLRKITGNQNFKTAIESAHGSSLGPILRKNFLRPFILCIEPIVLAFTLYLTIVYVILFTFLDGYTYIFARTYGINEGLSNVCFIGLFVGVSLSTLLVPFVYRSTAKQLKRDGDDGSGKALARESRLFFAMIGAPALPIGLFWMGWTDYPSISIWSPLSASVLVGFSNICIFMSAYMYIIDSYEDYAASALASVAIVRYLAAGGMTVVGIPMYENLGTHWTLTVLGIISALAVPIPYVMYRWGSKLRRHSKWAAAAERI